MGTRGKRTSGRGPLKPILTIAATLTPEGRRLALCRHDRDFSITIDRQELMSSRASESERALARLGCARLAEHRNPSVLIGGLGMGFTLRETLDRLQPRARVVVAEWLPDVVRWNRDFLGGLNNHPLRDPRVELRIGDVIPMIRETRCAFDAILLDIDNGPAALTAAGNDWLYGRSGIRACTQALHARGCLAVWSATPDPAFERRLRQEGLHVARYGVPAYKGGKPNARHIWIASPEPQTIAPRPAPVLSGSGRPDAAPPRPGHGRC